MSQLQNLPIGGQYQSKDGNATATAKRTDKGIEITAECDSLVFLVTSLETLLYKSNRENSELTEKLKEQKTQIIKEPTSLQWFQIWGFRLLSIIILIKYIIKKYKPKFLK